MFIEKKKGRDRAVKSKGCCKVKKKEAYSMVGDFDDSRSDPGQSLGGERGDPSA